MRCSAILLLSVPSRSQLRFTNLSCFCPEDLEHLTTLCSWLQVTQLSLDVTSRLNCIQPAFIAPPTNAPGSWHYISHLGILTIILWLPFFELITVLRGWSSVAIFRRVWHRHKDCSKEKRKRKGSVDFCSRAGRNSQPASDKDCRFFLFFFRSSLQKSNYCYVTSRKHPVLRLSDFFLRRSLARLAFVLALIRKFILCFL